MSGLSEHERTIVEAVRENHGKQRGFYHQRLLDDDRTPYEDPEDEDYSERGLLGETMWRLDRDERRGNTSYTIAGCSTQPKGNLATRAVVRIG